MKTVRSYSSPALAVLLATGAAATMLTAGPTDPPAGPVASTFKTLGEVQPRTNVQSLPGSVDALYVISQPGSYYLTGNITGVSGKHGILITTGGVTLDLGGFRLTGVSGARHGVMVAPGLFDVSVCNGTVQGWPQNCVEAGNAANCRFENLQVRGGAKSGISAGFHPVVTSCQTTGNAEWGIFANDRAVITNCIANGNTFDGIIAGPASILSGCAATSNHDSGFALGSGSNISGCSAVSNAGAGFDLAASVNITACTASNNTGGGILSAGGAAVTGSTFAGNGLFGFKATGGGVSVSGCVARNNTGDGIVLQSMSTVANCTCDGNTAAGAAAGIRLAGQGNRADSNALSNNKIGLDADNSGNLVVRNSFTFNPVRIEAAAGNTVSQIIVTPGGAFVSTDPWANFAH